MTNDSREERVLAALAALLLALECAAEKRERKPEVWFRIPDPMPAEDVCINGVRVGAVWWN